MPRVMGSPPRGGREGGGGAPLPLRSPLCWLPRGSPVAPPWLPRGSPVAWGLLGAWVGDKRATT